MRGGAIPPSLLCAALGLALAFAPRRSRCPSLLALTAAAIAFSCAPVPQSWVEAAVLACWVSVAASASSVHLFGGLSPWGALALSLNAGLWAGSVVAIAGSWLDLMKALPWALLVLPASLTVRWRLPVAIKVVSSWLIAVAALEATLQFLPVTPGYMPDHME